MSRARATDAMTENQWISVVLAESRDYECLLCFDLCEGAVSCTGCSVLLCGACVKQTACCPQCKAAPSRTIFVYNMFADKQIKLTKVKCTHCKWEGDFIDYKQVHSSACSKAPVQCVHCKAKVERQLLAPHLETCTERMERCRFCDDLLSYISLQDHHKNCPHSALCELCNTYQLADSLQWHRHSTVGWCSTLDVENAGSSSSQFDPSAVYNGVKAVLTTVR